MSLPESKNESRGVGLLDLPNELLFLIIGDDDLSWRDHFNIHHVSSRLLHLTFKHVYDGKRDIFLDACSSANLDLIIECLKHRNVPTSQLWERRHSVYRTPLDVLSFSFVDGDCSVDQYIKVAEWLFDNGYQTQQVLCRQGEMTYSRVVSPFLLAMFSTATDADNHRDICQVVGFLLNQGLGFPGASTILQRASYEKIRKHPGYAKFAEESGSDMHLILQSAFPPGLSEVSLKKLASDLGLTLKSRLAPGYRDDLNICESTKLSELVRILFDDLFAPWIYKGDSPSYFADTFEAKIKLLVEHDGIGGHEQPALENILEALRSIEARQRENGGLDFERDGTWCWRELCVSIRQASSQDHGPYWNQYSLEDPPRVIRPDLERCVHEFVRPKLWYPPKDLIDARSYAFRKIYDKLDPSWLEDSTEQDWVSMPLDAWNFIHRVDDGTCADDTSDEDGTESEADE
ncbi:uncharacterized protein FTJAE_13078 [Fusarium tjaetaba]|uniref:Uncharacterized protein n=1 Tax=Fusarium tjaetaba TaxID=1567544 RepID=A0A8H5QGL0_9HYPO|nr:uncharacterized protein FTJAE_13078 [Fusarium tjaetaba]KAF5616135.1 hypothetical protein FTJAE_13078 [Fusarium tjaetaba]